MYKTGKKTIVVDGKEYNFKFGMNTLCLCEDQMKKDLSEGFLIWARTMLWAGLKIGQGKDLPAEFSLDDMGLLIDAMGKEQYDELMDEATDAMGKMKDLYVKVMGKANIEQTMRLLQTTQIQ